MLIAQQLDGIRLKMKSLKRTCKRLYQRHLFTRWFDLVHPVARHLTAIASWIRSQNPDATMLTLAFFKFKGLKQSSNFFHWKGCLSKSKKIKSKEGNKPRRSTIIAMAQTEIKENHDIELWAWSWALFFILSILERFALFQFWSAFWGGADPEDNLGCSDRLGYWCHLWSQKVWETDMDTSSGIWVQFMPEQEHEQTYGTSNCISSMCIWSMCIW